MRSIYLVRHGETDFNLNRIVQGRGVDSDINTTGQKQAEAFFKMYGNVAFDHLFISALKRTKQTMHHFIEKGIPTTALPELDEINFDSDKF